MRSIQKYLLMVILVVCSSPAWAGTVTDIDGNTYQTVTIGTQEWMAENLKVKRYRNGEDIPNVTDAGTWGGLTTGAYCAYGNDVNNVATYGLLYNWHAAIDPRNIAPTGWHVPTDAELKQLEKHLGMSQVEADNTGWRGTDEGNKLKEAGTTHWNSSSGSTNESGFTALPAGYRIYYGEDLSLGDSTYFWSSTLEGSVDAWYRGLHLDRSTVYRIHGSVHYGFSIRCVREALDSDSDGVPDYVDNCPTVYNPEQADGDADGVGDACDNCPAVLNPDQIYREDFSSDVFGSGSWSRSDASVYVDTENGWLRIGSNGVIDDFADKLGPFPLPLVIEWRERTFSGSGSYFSLPMLELWWGQSHNDNDDYHLTYVQDDQSGNPADDGWLFGWSWSDSHTLGTTAWDQWRTVKAIIRSDGGELFAKQDGDLDFTPIVSATWARPNVIQRIRLSQHSDNVSDFDYVVVNSGQADSDGDGKGDVCDNCPTDYNPLQEDLDSDALGDVCDPDIDEDGVANEVDNCPINYNPGQEDFDSDVLGDACDPDIDNDGLSNLEEAAIGSNPASLDSDGDGVRDYEEVFAEGGSVSDPADTDSDGLPNVMDPDDDGDGIPTVAEDINVDGNPANDDTDGDGQPNYLEYDDDADGIPTPFEDIDHDGTPANDDTDGDGQPNYLEYDDDADGIPTPFEDIDHDGNPANDDTDGDGQPNYLEYDDDGDGIPTPFEDIDQDGNPANDDTDSDGEPNYLDYDDDGDGVLTPSEDVNHDGNPANDDTDSDGQPNYLDADDDGDGILTAVDNCPLVANPGQEDTDGDLIGDACDGCCVGRVGDANGIGAYPHEVTISDVQLLVTAKFISSLPCEQSLSCLAEADANQTGGADPKCSDVTISDIQTLVNHLFIAGPANAPLKVCL